MLSKKTLGMGILLLSLAASWVHAQGTGRIEGTVQRQDGSGVGGVSVVLDKGRTEITSVDGAFVFGRVAAGTHSVSFTLGDNSQKSEVQVEAGETATMEETVDWDSTFADTISVISVSRKRERIVEAPAAVTALSQEEIESEAAPGQLPKLIEFTPGVEITQSGVYDFNLNVRGLNSPLTRRVQTIVDGRELAGPNSGAQNWEAFGFLSDDLATVELVRGPSAALYGPNTFNGVFNLVTKLPRDSQGGMVRLTGGELDTQKGDLRWAGALGNDWYYKVLAGHTEGDGFTRSRTESVEYPGLPLELRPLGTNRIEIDSGMLRLDKHLGDGVLSLEGAISEVDNQLLVLPFGRGQGPEYDREWVRVNYNSNRWNFLGYHNTRTAPIQFQLGAGAPVAEDSFAYRFELQGNRDLAAGRGRLVGGLSYGERENDSSGTPGVPPLLSVVARSDEKAVFSQLDYDLSDKLKLVLAARWDEGTLHDSRISPKGSLVYGLTPRHTLRLGYNESFQAPTFINVFLQIPIGPPLDLSGFEESFAPLLGGVPLGLGFIPARAFGNEDLDAEEIETFEVGYSAVLGKNALLRIDYFNNRIKNFITPLLPGVNPNFPPYRAPSQLPPPVAGIVEGALNGAIPGLTNDPVTGAPLFVISSVNTGGADSQGVELAWNYAVTGGWLFDFTYTWFDFEITDEFLGPEVQPNTAENRASFGVSYRQGPLSASLRARWVEAFLWVSGPFVGPVPSYEVVNLSLSYDVTDHWEVGANVSNLLDNSHYELFGGDLIERRALAFIAFSW